MQGLVFEGNRTVALHDFADPRPAPGEVVLRITASGMCGSDLHYYRDEPSSAQPCIGGHEPAGVIEELGPGVELNGLGIGDRVMVHHYAGCGQCPSCRSGWTQMCSAGSRVYGKSAHGSHADHMTVAAGSVMALPSELSAAAGAAIGCGTGTAWGGLDRLGDLGGRDLIVFGQGPVGLSATMLAQARGARVIAVDLADSRLDQARTLGAADTVNPAATDAVAAIRDLTHGGAAAALDTSGSTAAASTALASLAPWGRFCVVGLGGTVEVDVRSYLSRQLTVMTSWSMSSVQQIACAEFVAHHRLPVDDLFTHEWKGLERAAEAYALFDQQTEGKGVFLFD